MKSWIDSTRDKLLKNERGRINLRAECWQNIVNDGTNAVIGKINNKLNINIAVNDIFIYKPSNKEMNIFLSYLISWHGLNTKLIQNTNQPKNIQDYELKAKNWANGCRAREYAKSLYPNMIEAVEKYANNVSHKLSSQLMMKFKCNNNKFNKLIFNILMYSYLAKLCEQQVYVLSGKRTVSLLCDNSIKARKSNITRTMFQKYANDHNYNAKFPRHRKEAVDYFTRKIYKTFDQLFNSLLCPQSNNVKKAKVPKIDIQNVHILDAINYIGTHCKSSNGNRVIIHRETWDMIQSAATKMEKITESNFARINDLRQTISDLETFNDSHSIFNQQQMMMMDDVMNRSPSPTPTRIIKMECDDPLCDMNMINDIMNMTDYDMNNMNNINNMNYYNHEFDSDDGCYDNAI